MLNIPDSIKALYQRDDVQKNFRVQFPNGELPDITNENVVAESVRLTESLCSQEVLKFGLTEAPVIEFETVGVANMYGMKIECFSEIDTSSLTAAQIADIQAMTDLDGELVLEADSDLGWGFYRLPLGVFHVDSCPRSHGQMSHRKVTAYGTILNAAKPSSSLMAYMRYAIYSKRHVNIEDLLYGGYGVTTFHSEVAYETTEEEGDWQTLFMSQSYEYQQGRSTNALIQVKAYKKQMATLGGDEKVAKIVRKPRTSISYAKSVISDVEDAVEIAKGITDYRGREIFWSLNASVLTERVTDVFKYIARTRVLNETPTVLGHIVEEDTTVPFYTEGTGRLYIDAVCAFAIRIVKKYDGSRIYDEDVLYEKTFERLSDIYFYTITGNAGLEMEIPTAALNAWPYKGQMRDLSAIDVEALAIGALELGGGVGMWGRDGNFRKVTINTQSPVPISPSQYSELWWDEYDVAPIGMIKYKYKADDDMEVIYQFSDGESAYDMSDNYVLQNMNKPSEDAINALLDEYFIPNIQDVYFTPTECDLKGLPYLEAGDYLEIDSGDVDEDDQPIKANTYIMRRTLSGIQSLTDSIESSGGEIISGGYYVTEVNNG